MHELQAHSVVISVRTFEFLFLCDLLNQIHIRDIGNLEFVDAAEIFMHTYEEVNYGNTFEGRNTFYHPGSEPYDNDASNNNNNNSSNNNNNNNTSI